HRRILPTRACVAGPPCGSTRAKEIPAGIEFREASHRFTQSKPGATLTAEVPPKLVANAKVTAAMVGRKVPSALTNREGIHELDTLKGVQLIGTAGGTRVKAEVKGPAVVYPPCNLLLGKWGEAQDPQIGDKVTFFLRYFNR